MRASEPSATFPATSVGQKDVHVDVAQVVAARAPCRPPRAPRRARPGESAPGHGSGDLSVLSSISAFSRSDSAVWRVDRRLRPHRLRLGADQVGSGGLRRGLIDVRFLSADGAAANELLGALVLLLGVIELRLLHPDLRLGGAQVVLGLPDLRLRLRAAALRAARCPWSRRPARPRPCRPRSRRQSSGDRHISWRCRPGWPRVCRCRRPVRVGA